MNISQYTIVHLGFGKFLIEMSNGQTIEADHNLVTTVRYTYFEDYTLPKIGWRVTQEQLMKDHQEKLNRQEPRVSKAVIDCNI